MLSALLFASLSAVPTQVVDPGTGVVTLQRGVLSAPLQGELSSAARMWALSKRDELGLPADSTLVNAESFGTRFGASMHLQQQREGVEVYAAKVVVTVDQAGRVILVSSSAVGWTSVASQWRFTEAQALKRAALEVPLPSMKEDGSPFGAGRKVYLKTGDVLRAAWVVHVPTVDVTQNWYLGIDAATGAVLFKQNRVFKAALDANAYTPSPGGLDAGVGATPTTKVTLTHSDGGSMLAAGQTVLVGTQLDAFMCCPSKDCDLSAPEAGPKRSMGTTQVPNFINPAGPPITVMYNVATCDFQHRATNDPAKHDAGTFEYAPVDPPAAGAVAIGDPAGMDEFAEVHAFYQVNRVYDWVRGLSRAAAPVFPTHQPALVPFSMRDERRMPARKPAIWANVVFPDFQALFANPTCLLTNTTCVIDTFTRIDNAAFLAQENFVQIPLPEYRNDVDTLMIFQGQKCDFGYDAPVLWHEFGHGVVYSTANLGFDRLAMDSRSANNESGALHEGLADYIAGAFGENPDMGTYVGPRILGGANMTGIRTDSYLRSLDNTLSCPDVIVGEVHEDSQHVAAALWRARQDVFQGTDNGKTFDAVFYAMLVSLSPTADFASVAASMSTHVTTAFPGVANAATRLGDLFDLRGVTNCSKVVDMTGKPPRGTYGIGGKNQTTLSGTPAIPGPVQLKLKVPNGTATVTVSASVGGNALGIGGGTATLKLLAKANAPITFTRNGNTLINDSQANADMPVTQSVATGVVNVETPCGATSEVYVSIANLGADAANLGNVSVTTTPLPNCGVDAGGTGGGAGGGGGSSEVHVVPAIGVEEHPMKGCGCNEVPMLAPLAFGLAMLLRRRRS